MSKRTFQPSRIKRKRTHGFRKRMQTKNGRQVINRRRSRGRKSLSAAIPQKQRLSKSVGRYIFPSSARLKKRREFSQMIKMGCKVHTPHFILYKMPSTIGESRLGLTVSRKVGNAVCRNRVKRLLREYFRQYRHAFSQPMLLSIIAKRSASRVSLDMIEKELNFLLKG